MSGYVNLSAAFSRFSISPARGTVKVNDEYKGVVTGTSVYGLHVGINAKMSRIPGSKRAIGLVFKARLSNSLNSGSTEPDVERVVRDDLRISKGDAVDVKVIEIRNGKPGFELVNRAPCPNYLLGLCTFAHPWLSKTTCCRDGSHELRPGLRPAGYDKWLVNQGLAPRDLINMGWVYGGLLRLPNVQDRMAYHRVSVAAIRELRSQYGQVMSDVDQNLPQGKLFYERPEETTAHLWKDARSPTDLQSAVFGVRVLVERLAYLSGSAVAGDYLLGAPLTMADRWRNMRFHAFSLLRSADDGPDGPVQWSGHGQLNHHSYTEVTERSIIEVVAKLGVILEVLFEGRNADGVNPRAVSTALIAAFSAPPILEGDKETTQKGTPSKKQAYSYPSTVLNNQLELFELLQVKAAAAGAAAAAHAAVAEATANPGTAPHAQLQLLRAVAAARDGAAAAHADVADAAAADHANFPTKSNPRPESRVQLEREKARAAAADAAAAAVAVAADAAAADAAIAAAVAAAAADALLTAKLDDLHV